MSVLIKGMNMPERCWDCDLCYDCFYCRLLEVRFIDREDFEPGERRLSDCPLVPVPPHGRLIDADALLSVIATEHKRIAETYGENDEYALCLKKYAMTMVTDAQTIIPAEED